MLAGWQLLTIGHLAPEKSLPSDLCNEVKDLPANHRQNIQAVGACWVEHGFPA